MNRRRYPRVKALNLIKWNSVFSKASSLEESPVHNIRDLSESGVKFYSESLPEEKKLVELKLVLAELDKEIEALGSISWSKPANTHGSDYYEAGISFVEMKKEDRDFLRKHIQDLRSVNA